MGPKPIVMPELGNLYESILLAGRNDRTDAWVYKAVPLSELQECSELGWKMVTTVQSAEPIQLFKDRASTQEERNGYNGLGREVRMGEPPLPYGMVRDRWTEIGVRCMVVLAKHRDAISREDELMQSLRESAGRETDAIQKVAELEKKLAIRVAAVKTLTSDLEHEKQIVSDIDADRQKTRAAARKMEADLARVRQAIGSVAFDKAVKAEG